MALRLVTRPSGLLIPVDDLGIKGTLPGQLTLGDDLPFVLALNAGFDGNQSRLLKVDGSGNLRVAVSAIAFPAGVRVVDINNSNIFRQGANSDANAPVEAPGVLGFSHVFNGAAWDRARGGGVVILAGMSSNGAALVASPGEWSVASAPGAGVQASASRAAGGAGVRHILRSFAFSAGSVVAPVLTALQVVVRDGVSGGGTVLKVVVVIIAAAVGQNVPPIEISGLNVVGSANTAMTVEFSAALANVLQGVSITGYDAS